MRVLLTGAFGNVGKETIRALIAGGHDVRAFELPSKRNEKVAAQFAKSGKTLELKVSVSPVTPGAAASGSHETIDVTPEGKAT